MIRETVTVKEAHTIKLAALNAVLKYSGFRLCVGEDKDGLTLIGVVFFGWSFLWASE